MLRKALVVGIDDYLHMPRLHGCVNDAHSVKAVLERNGDGTRNFDVQLLVGTGQEEFVSRMELREMIRELFQDEVETALFYFAGHGHVEQTGGYILAVDSLTGDDGVPLAEVLTLANNAKITNKIIVLDSCHSGMAGADPSPPHNSILSDGMTILTASTKDQYSIENRDGGLFTGLFVDALNGAAANLVGDITPGSVYAHIDQSLGSWGQRPVFKTNVKKFVSLRKVTPPITLEELQQITTFFPDRGVEYRLDPSYEPEGPCPNRKNTKILRVLQKMNRVNLVVPVGAPHMYHAAMESKSCKLTPLGEHYRRLVALGRI